ncbi:hypothetical protein [Aquimarina algicola]|uniref:Uncharacterized protein n=1 Tax=Aquimarina algicola TaxID=2589995 RepID=A0A504J5A2_9FLAO|nr:hypothetical protein [Aquimarina algicola]TPN81381.1 hypothetical protein FHK87_25690 [Aquimarina algicola]
MKKSILKITGVQQLSKTSQQKINGGSTSSGCPIGRCFDASMTDVDVDNSYCIVFGSSGELCFGTIQQNSVGEPEKCCI